MLRKIGRSFGVLAVLGALALLTGPRSAPAGEECCGEIGAAARGKSTAATAEACEGEKKEACEGEKDACGASCPVTKLLRPYFAIGKALAADSLEGVAQAAEKLARCSGCRIGKDPGDEMIRALGKLAAAAAPLHQAAARGDLEAARAAFHELSRAAIALVEAAEKAGQPLGRITIYSCSMSKPYGKWLQLGEGQIANPYQGSKMLRCGARERTLGNKTAARPTGAGRDACCGAEN